MPSAIVDDERGRREEAQRVAAAEAAHELAAPRPVAWNWRTRRVQLSRGQYVTDRRGSNHTR